jgi:DNA-directed RNA polymerase specialized sigma24 family protein
MSDQNLALAPATAHLLAEDSALQLFQIAALLLGNQSEAVDLVEEVLDKVETDPCADGTQAYTEARTLLVRAGVQRLAGRNPGDFDVPLDAPAVDTCIETDDLHATGVSSEQLGALVSGAGRVGMREWLDRLTPALRAIFVLRAVAGQDGEQTAESLRQSGGNGAQGWRSAQVGSAYRQALCSLASRLMSAQSVLVSA